MINSWKENEGHLVNIDPIQIVFLHSRRKTIPFTLLLSFFSSTLLNHQRVRCVTIESNWTARYACRSFFVAVSTRPVSAMSNLSENQRFEQDQVGEPLIDASASIRLFSLRSIRKPRRFEWSNATSNWFIISKTFTTKSPNNCTVAMRFWETSNDEDRRFSSHVNRLQFVPTNDFQPTLSKNRRTIATFQIGLGPKSERNQNEPIGSKTFVHSFARWCICNTCWKIYRRIRGQRGKRTWVSKERDDLPISPLWSFRQHFCNDVPICWISCRCSILEKISTKLNWRFW